MFLGYRRRWGPEYRDSGNGAAGETLRVPGAGILYVRVTSGGKMISRRPKRRASTENAPGPTVTMRHRTASPKTSAALESSTVGVGAGMRESQAPRGPSAAKLPAKGVRKPVSSGLAARIAAEPTAQAARGAAGSRK